MQPNTKRRLSIRQLVNAARHPCTIRELAGRCRVSGKEVGQVIEIAIDAGLIRWDSVTERYKTTRLGKERVRSSPRQRSSARAPGCGGGRSRKLRLANGFRQRPQKRCGGCSYL
jgi:hypothetical protein